MNNKICPKCKIAPINTNSGVCKLCKKEYMKQYYLENKEDFLERNNKNFSAEARKKWYEENKEEIIKSLLEKNTKCQLCTDSAECHHHNTFPILYNQFNFLCNKYHKGIHTQLNIIGGYKQ